MTHVIRIDADPKAVLLIQKQGGRLYVWTSSAGIEHETTSPRAGIDFVQLPGDGFDLFVDPSIEAAERWQVEYQRFPRPHVRALWNGGAYSPGGSHVPQWQGKPPWAED